MGTGDVVADLVAWTRESEAPPLQADLVAGTDETERSRLAALGGVVQALVPSRVLKTWPDAVQEWCANAGTPPRQLLDSTVFALAHDSKFLATVYEQLVSGRNRRRLGTFFTPDAVVRFMFDRAAKDNASPTRLVDPGAGVGAFALAGAERWPAAQVDAVDLNVVTLGLLGLASFHKGLKNVRLIHADYMDWLRTEPAPHGPRLLIGNPPYTRHQELDPKLKRLIAAQNLDLVDSGLAGLSAYFLAASIDALRPNDRLCLVLPTTWTEARYGRGLRQWLWASTDRTAELHVFSPKVELFPGTNVAALVLVVGTQRMDAQKLTVHQAQLSGSRVKTTRGDATPRKHEAPQSLGPLLWPQTKSKHIPNLISLGSRARVRRGVATGANQFFFISDADRDQLPEGAVLPALRRLRHVEGDLLGKRAHDAIGAAGQPRWLLWLNDSAVVKDPRVRKLIKRGDAEGLRDRVLVSLREPWYLVEQVDPPDLFIAMMGKERIRAVRNVVGAVPSNSMYGIYLQRKQAAADLCSWLNSAGGQRELFSVGKHYSGGLRKLEPGNLLQVRVPRSVT